MNILVACNEKYLRLAKYMLFSLYENNGNLNVYLIHENVSDSSISDFSNFFDIHGIGNLNVIKFDSSTIDLPLKDDLITGHITKEAYFRLYAPFFLPDDMERILYLDCDIICVNNISDFYNMDFEGNVLAGGRNTDLDNSLYIDRLGLPSDFIYINSGVLLFNLKLYKETTSINSLNKFIADNYSILDFQDQDVINKMFCGKMKYFSIYYNFQIGMLLYNEGGKLIHYTGPVKPWYDDYARPILAQPYYDVLFRLGEYDELDRIKNIHLKNFRESNKIISAIVYGKDITEEIIQNITRQSENRIEFIITYDTIEDGLIEKYKTVDCRLFFVENSKLDDYYDKLLGLYYAYFNVEDFSNMDVNFIREIIFFADHFDLSIVFYNNFCENCSGKIIEYSDNINVEKGVSLIDENVASGYSCIHICNFNEMNSNKYGYWENDV